MDKRMDWGSPDVQDLHLKAQQTRLVIDRVMDQKIAEALPRNAARVVAIPIIVGVPGTPLSAGNWGDIRLDLNRDVRLLRNSMYSKISGSCVIDLQTSDHATYPTTASICAAAKPTLSASFKSEDTTLTGWTTDLVDGTVLDIVVDSADGTVEVVSLTLRALVLEQQII